MTPITVLDASVIITIYVKTLKDIILSEVPYSNMCSITDGDAFQMRVLAL